LADEHRIYDLQAESGILASLVCMPELYFQATQLTPKHFYDKDNGYIYFALTQMAKDGVQNVDAYNIMMTLNKNKHLCDISRSLTEHSVNEMVRLSKVVARSTVEEYMIVVNNVMDKAFRRSVYSEVEYWKKLCETSTDDNIKLQIQSKMDAIISEFTGIDDVKPFSSLVDGLWDAVVQKHNNSGISGLPSAIPKANDFFSYEPQELVLGCALRKEGKSMFALTEICHKLEMGKSVLCIDTEMSDQGNFERMVSHVSKVSVSEIKRGTYKSDLSKIGAIERAMDWIKSKNYTHIYMPTPDVNKIYALIKRMQMNGTPFDFIVYDYIKSQGTISSSEVYNQLGDTINFLKNRVAGELKVPILALAQLNRGGDIGESLKLEQFASTVFVLRRKSNEETQRDGFKCGNYKLYVKLNRLGEQMGNIDEDYIDIQFDGNVARFSQAEFQHDADSSPF